MAAAATQFSSTMLGDKSDVKIAAGHKLRTRARRPFTCICLLKGAACRPLSVALGIRLLANSSWKGCALTAASAGPLLPAADRRRSGTMAEADTTSLESAARAPPPPSASPTAGQLGRESTQQHAIGDGANRLCLKFSANAPAMAIGGHNATAAWRGASSKCP